MLPMSYWGEALHIACLVINLSPFSPLNGDVGESVWFGCDVDYKTLEVFGCRAFVHIPKYERTKLHDKYRQCIS